VPDLAKVETIFNTLSERVRISKDGRQYAGKLAVTKRTNAGVLAPDFTEPDTAGKPVSLHDYKGKYVLVDFWASWCAPCRAENPNVLKAYNKYKAKGFNVLGVSMDEAEAKDKWIKAIRADKVTWTQVSDLKGWENVAGKLYGIEAILQNFSD